MLADVPHPVSQTWKIHQVASSRRGASDKGSVSGAPFGAGSVTTHTTLNGSKVLLRFTEKLRKGTLRGTIDVDFKFISSTRVRYSGKGNFTGGTGAYQGASGPITSFSGTNHGRRATLRLKGTATY